jgi:hypothetical protein
MLIQRLFLSQGSQGLIFFFFENAKAFYLTKACVLLICFFHLLSETPLRLKYFQVLNLIQD